jgi:hypothetical protein
MLSAGLLAGSVLGVAAATAATPIETVVLERGHSLGFGNAITVVYRPRVLFADGRWTGAPASALSDAPRIDGRWQRDGDTFVLTTAQGQHKRIAASQQARPASPGMRLDGEYRRSGGAGAAGTGTAVVAAWSAWRFHPDGRLAAAQGAGATAGGVATDSATGQAARYRLDGWTLTVEHGDGRRERQLFYRFPDSDRAIGVGAQVLSRR